MSYANVVATVAMVFAMTGGAYAASKFLITSTKQIKPSVLAQLKGKAGANGAPGAPGSAGPAGPQGPTGANGKDGAPGAAGEQGSAGPKGATGAAGAPGPAGAKGAAGAAGATGPQGSTGASGPTGPEGSPWVDGGTLPSGQTETGTWAINQPETTTESSPFEPISFPIQLEKGDTLNTAFFIDLKETEEKEGPNVTASGCTGSASEPTAPKGKLCIYTAAEEENEGKAELEPFGTGSEGVPGEYGKTGSYVQYYMEASVAKPVKITDRGTWAVTSP